MGVPRLITAAPMAFAATAAAQSPMLGATSAGAWAPAASAAIHPGVQLFTNGSQCTANFIFSDGTNTYIGQAAHCSGTGGDLSRELVYLRAHGGLNAQLVNGTQPFQVPQLPF